MTYFVLFVIGIADRVVRVAGIANLTDESWMLQIGGHLLAAEDGALAGKRNLIVDRDTKYSTRFSDFIAEGGTEVIRLPPPSPKLNAFRDPSVCRALTEHLTHLLEERNDQGLEIRLIRELPAVAANDASIHRRTRLGGMFSNDLRVVACGFRSSSSTLRACIGCWEGVEPTASQLAHVFDRPLSARFRALRFPPSSRC